MDAILYPMNRTAISRTGMHLRMHLTRFLSGIPGNSRLLFSVTRLTYDLIFSQAVGIFLLVLCLSQRVN